jgi:hypothetical protein
MTPKTDQETPAQSALEHYTAATRAVLQIKGQAPFALAGLEIYETLEQIEGSLSRSLQHKQHPVLEEIQALTQHRLAFKATYQRLRRQQDYVLGLAARLDPPRMEQGAWTQTGAEVAQAVDRYLDGLRVTQELYPEDEPVIDHMLRRTAAWAPGLYFCYDEPHIPRTNNGLERYIEALKRQRRRITGRTATADYLARHGPYLVFHDASETTEEVLARFREVPFAAFRQEREHFRAAHAVQSRMRSFRRDSEGFLQRAEALWCTDNPP